MLDEKQQRWITDFSNQLATKSQFDKEFALKQVIIQRVTSLIDKNQDKLRAYVTFEVGKRKSLDVEGSQMDEADSTEYGQAEMTVDQLMKISAVDRFMGQLRAIMEDATVKRPNSKGVLEDQPLFTDQEIADELYTPLVRARLYPETLVPGSYSETAKMIEGSNKAYIEDLEEYTKECAEEEQDLVSTGLGGVSSLADIGKKLTAAFPGEDAKLAGDILGLISVGTNTVAVTYDAIKASEFNAASGTIIDNIGVLMKGIMKLVINEEVANAAGDAYVATTSVAKVSLAIADRKPGLALAELATGMEAAFKTANRGDKDPQAGQIVSFVAAQLKNAKNLDPLIEAAENRDFAGVVDGVTNIAKGSMSASLKYAGDVEKIQHPEREEAINKKYEDLDGQLSGAIEGAGALIKSGEAVVKLVKEDAMAAGLESLLASLGGVLSGSLAAAAVDPQLAKTIGTAFTASSNGGVAVVYIIENPRANSEHAAALMGKAISGTMTSADPNNEQLKTVAGYVETGFVSLAGGLGMVEAYRSGDPEEMKKFAKNMTGILRTVLGQLKGELSEDDINEMTAGMSEKEKEEFLQKQEEFKQQLDEESQVFDEEAITEGLKALNSEQAAENLKKSEEEEALKRINEQKGVMQVLKEGTEIDQEAARSINELIVEMQKDQMMMQMAIGVAKGGIALATKWVPALGTATTAIQMAESLMQAANRAMALREWLDHQKDLKSAQDALESSAQNFVKNQTEQFSHHATQAALKVVQLIGQVLELSGLASAAGTALKASADAASAAEEVIYKFYRKATLEAAWSLTQKALANPKNRRLGLEARALNPTLAKYSIAWSAMVRENPMARSIMNDIGLNEGTLRNKDSNVKNVVKFMELKFSEDIQVRKKIDLAGDYMPKAKFNGKAWGVAVTRAKKDGLKNPPSGKLDGLVSDAYVRKQEIERRIKSMEVTSEECELFIQILTSLDEELANYRPMKTATTGAVEAHIPMQGFVENMRDACLDVRIFARNALAEAEEFELGQAMSEMFATAA